MRNPKKKFGKNLFLEHKLKRRKTTENYIYFVEKLKRYSLFSKNIVSFKLNYTNPIQV